MYVSGVPPAPRFVMPADDVSPGEKPMQAQTWPSLHRVLSGAMIAIAGACSTACGGADTGDPSTATGGVCVTTTIHNCGSGPWDPFGIALLFAWVGRQCSQEVSCESQTQTDLSTGIVSDSYINSTWDIGFIPDREPNDSTSSALPAVMRSGGGIFLSGRVNDTTDPRDMMALGVESASDAIAIYLCATPQTCTLPFLQTDKIHIELYDQAGTLMQTTNMMQSPNGHSITLLPVQRAGYFIAVVARDTGGSDFAYRLNIVD